MVGCRIYFCEKYYTINNNNFLKNIYSFKLLLSNSFLGCQQQQKFTIFTIYAINIRNILQYTQLYAINIT